MVTLYTTASCGYCKMAKAYFSEKGITITEHDVGRDAGKAEEMVRKSGQMGVPVLDIHGKIIVGFNVPLIERALGS